MADRGARGLPWGERSSASRRPGTRTEGWRYSALGWTTGSGTSGRLILTLVLGAGGIRSLDGLQAGTGVPAGEQSSAGRPAQAKQTGRRKKKSGMRTITILNKN